MLNVNHCGVRASAQIDVNQIFADVFADNRARFAVQFPRKNVVAVFVEQSYLRYRIQSALGNFFGSSLLSSIDKKNLWCREDFFFRSRAKGLSLSSFVPSLLFGSKPKKLSKVLSVDVADRCIA